MRSSVSLRVHLALYLFVVQMRASLKQRKHRSGSIRSPSSFSRIVASPNFPRDEGDEGEKVKVKKVKVKENGEVDDDEGEGEEGKGKVKEKLMMMKEKVKKVEVKKVGQENVTLRPFSMNWD